MESLQCFLWKCKKHRMFYIHPSIQGIKKRTRTCLTNNCPGNYLETTTCMDATCVVSNASWGGKPSISHVGKDTFNTSLQRGRSINSRFVRRRKPLLSPPIVRRNRKLTRRGGFPRLSRPPRPSNNRFKRRRMRFVKNNPRITSSRGRIK